MRFRPRRRWPARALLTVVACAALGGCIGKGGAVTVRWRIVELDSGQTWNPATDPGIAGSDHFCCRRLANAPVTTCIDDDPNDLTADALATNWVVKKVEVELDDPDTGTPVQVTALGTFCTAGELTTPFILPTGRFAVRLVSTATDRTGTVAVQTSTPAAEIRDIVADSVVNLQIIEIGVEPLPLPLPPADAGVTQ
jgi:hypothetical protein